MRILTLGIVILMLFASFESSEKLATESLHELANRKFSIKEDQIREDDYDSMVTFGKSFVNLYTGAVAEQETVSFENYISNANLLKFTDKMLELTQKQELNGASSVNFGLDNEFKEEVFKKIDKNLYYLSLPFSSEGSAMTCKLLVQSSNKSLEIVDLYFGYKDGVDTFTTGHPAERKINNPQIWDEQEWIDGVFEKLERYETNSPSSRQ